MDLPELNELNLTTGQIKVYQALLEYGTAGIHKIQEKTGLERRAIYDIINKLRKKGIVSYTIEKGKRVTELLGYNIEVKNIYFDKF